MDVEVDIELQAVRLNDMLAVALHFVVEVILLVEQVGVLRESHPLRDSCREVDGLDGLEGFALTALDAGYYLLVLCDIDFKVLHRLVSAVGDEDDILEPRMLKFGDYHLYRPAVRHVPRKLQIVDRQMRRKRVNDHLKCLFQRQVLLVVPPADIHQVEPVGGHRRGVHGAVLVLAHPFGAEPEQVHPVLLGNVLREPRDAGTRERVGRRRFHHALPLLDVGVGAAVKEEEVSERENVLGGLKVATEHLLQVIQKTCRPRDVVQEPCRTICPVQVSAAILHNTPVACSGQGLDLGKVPVGREDEPAALLQGCVKVCRVRMEPHVVVNNAPVLMGVMLLAVLVHRVGLRGSVPPSAVVMDTDLVYRAGLGRSACSHGCRYKY